MDGEHHVTCPRCGTSFTCGAPKPGCACGEVELTDALRARLAVRYIGCLCGRCLREVAEEDQEIT